MEDGDVHCPGVGDEAHGGWGCPVKVGEALGRVGRVVRPMEDGEVQGRVVRPMGDGDVQGRVVRPMEDGDVQGRVVRPIHVFTFTMALLPYDHVYCGSVVLLLRLLWPCYLTSTSNMALLPYFNV